MARHGHHRRSLEQKRLSCTVKACRLTPDELARYRQLVPKPLEPVRIDRYTIVRPETGEVVEVSRAQQLAFCLGDPDWQNAK